jgi:hypothetical protein
MAIRLPLTAVLDVTHTDQGTGSVAGGWAYPFKITQDTDNVVVKCSPSVTAGGVSVIFQTSDDGGSTYYDVARTSIASNSGATTVAGSQAQWLVVPTIGGVPRTVYTASIISAGSLLQGVSNGNAAASTLTSGQSSGLPIIGLQNRIFLISTGNATAISTRVQVLINQQSATA